MNNWYKYALSNETCGVRRMSISEGFEEYLADMQKHEENQTFLDKESFFDRYIHKSQRHKNYDLYLRKRLSRGEEILSIGSGLCQNELLLMESGYNVTCSDLKRLDNHTRIQALFPSFRHISVDLLSAPSQAKYDALLCLGIIFLFDDNQLLLFLRNAKASLRDGGHLIIDIHGPPDNFPAYLFHDVWLKYEARISKWLSPLLKGKRYGLVIKHHGYRRTTEEFMRIARACGFTALHLECYDFVTEFTRSHVLRRLLSLFPTSRHLLSLAGESLPFTRMCDLKAD